MAEQITVGPVESSDTVDYDEYVPVHREGEVIEVPVTNVKRWFYDNVTLAEGESADNIAEVPESIDYHRVFVENGQIYAEGWAKPWVGVTMVESSDGWSVYALDFAESFDEDEEVDLWTSPTKGRDELALLTSQGLSSAEALDFWVSWEHGVSSTEWSEYRNCSPQAVSENFRKANAKLKDD